MNSRSLVYAGVLLLGLVITAVILNRSVVQGVVNSGDVDLSIGSSTYILGQPIDFNGIVDFADQEEATIHQVQLNVSGPQGMTVLLPVAAGTFDLSNQPGVTGSLIVTVTFTNVSAISVGTLPSGTLPGGTLPGTTIPGSGQFKGDAAGARITYLVTWTPTVFLDPAPVFTLVPQTETLFSIPTLTPPATTTGTVLPNTDLEFTIPVVGAPTGAALPAVGSTFTIPTVSISTNATTTVPDLPDTKFQTATPSGATGGFNIPSYAVASAPSGVQSFPDSTFAFAIPTTTLATPPTGVPVLPELAEHFTITGSSTPRGLGSDGTDFWVISDNTGSGGVDEILRFTSSGVATGTAIVAPSSDLEGIAFLNDSLWVVENRFRCFDLIDSTRCDREHRIFKIDPDSPPAGSTEADWASLTTLNATDTFEQIGGITAEGGGTTGSLWLATKGGFKFYNISQTGSEVNSPFTDSFVAGMDGLAVSGDFLYTSKGSTITQWTKTGEQVQQFAAVVDGTTTPIGGIRGMTFKPVSSKQVLFVGSSDGKVYKGFFVESVTTDPVGITISPSTASVGRALWIVVDGNPKDKILKVDADTGSVITTFGTSGAADAPSKNIQGVTFLGGFLWLVANEDFERYLYKVNPANGALVSSFILGNAADIFDDLGGITNDGTNLIVHTRSFFNTVYVLDTTGQRTGASEAFPCCPSYNGARGLAYNSGRGQFFAGRDGTVGIYDSSLSFIREQMVTQPSSPISGIKGLAFDGDLLYIAHGSTGTITKSFLATTVTTKPKGIAFTSASTTPGKALWILVDGDPKDKLLKVDPDTGDLNTSFGTSGAVDAPSDRTEGITFLDTGDPTTSFLWIIANEGSAPKLYKINATTGALVTTLNLESTANIFDDLGGITNDGTNLIVHTRTFNDVIVLDPANGFEVERSFPCCANSGVFGATALTRHAGRGQFFAAKNDKLLTMDSARQLIEREQTVTLDGGSITGNIEGLAFDQDVLYVAQIDGSTGKVSIGALRVTATISPRGLAFSPEGSSLIGSPIGKALWVLVDGDPKDKILKIDPATNQLITAFGTSGAVDAPSSRTEGMTFLDGFLWIIANDNFERKLYKVRATNGTIAATFNLSGFPNGLIFDDMGGITNDGTNLLITVLPFNDVVIVDTSGQLVERKFTCCPITQGSRGAAYRTSKSQLFMAKGGTVMQADASGFEVQVVREFNTSLTGIQGLTFNGETLYVAHDGTGEISTTAVPSDVTNRPRGLTYDPNANELYILVDGAGKAKDHIVVVRPTATSTVNVLRDFPAPDNDTDGITFLGGSLYVAVRDQDNCCPPPTIVELNSQTGATINTLDVGQVLFDKITGLNNDGTSLIALPEFGGGQAIYIDPSDGSEVDRVFFFDPDDPGFFEERYDGLAFLTTTKNFFPVKDSTVFQFDEEGQKHAEFTIVTSGVDDIAGSVFVGQVLYVAEANGSTIRSARIPQAATVITNNPRGMATDGQTLFILVDATPKDKIMKLATTSTPITLDTSFGSAGAVDAPGKEAEGLAFHNGSLWVVTNEVRTFEIDGPFGPTFIKGVFPGLHRLDAMTGAELERFPISVIPQSFEELPILTDPIGSLASDGQFLYLGTKGDIGIEGVWYVFDPADPFAPVQRIDEISGSLPFLEGFEAMDMTIGAVFPANRELLATGRAGGAQADKLARFNKDTGEMFQQFDLTGSGPKDIMGLAYINRTLFLADNVSNTILGTALPENTVELTIAGSYTGQLTVDASPDTVDTVAVSSAVRAFSIGRNSQVAVQLTSPVDGSW